MALVDVRTAAATPDVVSTEPSSPSVGGLLGRLVFILALAAGVGWVVNHSPEYAGDAAQGVIFAIVGLSMNLLVGYTGQLSLGQQGFFGLGAMVAANVTASGLNNSDPLSLAFGLFASILICGAAALLLGIVALRITGLYLALITLVFGTAITDSLLGIPNLNGQDAGVPANRPAFLQTDVRFFLFCFALLLLVFYFDRRLTASKSGRAMLALKENERAAEAFGVNVVSYKLVAFGLSGAIAGLAGALDAFSSQEFSQKNYTDVRGFNLALTFVVIAVVGGLGNRVGVVVASVFFGILDPLLKGLFDAFGGSNYYIDHKNYLPGLIGAVLLLQTVIMNPGGLGQVLNPVSRWVSGGRFRGHHDHGGSPTVVTDVRA